jgi:hypothetical protein
VSETDIHHLVGFLYVITKEDDIVVLGERVLDVTTGTKRDVDVVVSGGWGMLGVEVKDKARVLDVGIVEGICQKFADMPVLTDRAIVSSSDYSPAARRKAKAHGTKCLRIIRGVLPPTFAGVDLTPLDGITRREASWKRPPAVEVVTRAGKAIHQLPGSTRLHTEADAVGPHTLGDAVARLAARSTGPSGPFTVRVQINYPLRFKSGGKMHAVASITARGLVSVSEYKAPPRLACYLADDGGEPLAAAVLFDHAGGLLGVASTSADRRISIIPIPAHVRAKRPFRKRLFRGGGG